MAYCCIIATKTKWDDVPVFLDLKKKNFDLSTLVYICLHSSNESSVLV